MSDQWEVRGNSEMTRRRVHFASSLEDEARDYVERNFPRVHVEPGVAGESVPDVVLHAPDGSLHTFHGPDSGWKSDQDAEEEA